MVRAATARERRAVQLAGGFERFVDEALCAAKPAGDVFASAEEDVAALQACLVCATGALLFDDVEVPSLVSLTTGAESVFVADAIDATVRYKPPFGA